MTQAAPQSREDLEQLRRRFEEFRDTRTGRMRLPETLWQDAGRAARRYGANTLAHELHLLVEAEAEDAEARATESQPEAVRRRQA